MDNQIRNIELSFTCHENWDGMAPTDGGRHCDQCNKTVHDLTNSKADEFIRILNEHNGSICGRFRIDQMAKGITAFPFWKKWVSAAMLLIGINLWNEQASAQSKPKQVKQQKVKFPLPAVVATNVDMPDTIKAKESLKQKQHTGMPEGLFGTFDVLPEFPGGITAYNAFIAKNVDQSKSIAPCRVNLTFVIEKDGSMSDIKVAGRKQNDGAEQEALRVARMMPKWKPGMYIDQPIRTQYTIPIMFK